MVLNATRLTVFLCAVSACALEHPFTRLPVEARADGAILDAPSVFLPDAVAEDLVDPSTQDVLRVDVLDDPDGADASTPLDAQDAPTPTDVLRPDVSDAPTLPDVLRPDVSDAPTPPDVLRPDVPDAPPPPDVVTSRDAGVTSTPGVSTATLRDSTWQTGFCERVTVTNTTSAPLTWTVVHRVAARVYVSWSSVRTGDRGDVVFRGAVWNRTLRPRERTEFGFCATR